MLKGEKTTPKQRETPNILTSKKQPMRKQPTRVLSKKQSKIAVLEPMPDDL